MAAPFLYLKNRTTFWNDMMMISPVGKIFRIVIKSQKAGGNYSIVMKTIIFSQRCGLQMMLKNLPHCRK